MTEHTWYKCTCDSPYCQFCEGCLSHCTVCDGFEGSLPTECPEVKLDKYVQDAIYKGGLDFVNGAWTYAPKEKR